MGAFEMRALIICAVVFLSCADNTLAKPFTTLEIGYVDDLHKMNYVAMMNFHCKYMGNDANININNMINDTAAMLGEDRIKAYHHGIGAKRFADQKRLFTQMNDLDFKPEEKKKACAAHKKEVMALYKKLIASTDEPGEAEDK